MATPSAHFNLTKPATTDFYNVSVVNANTDIIDEQLYNNQISAAKIMVGATEEDDGESGRVPVPLAGDEEKYLKANGTWDVPSGGTDMTGATSESDGTHGLVPAPSAGDNEKFLRGDGTWQTVSGGGGSVLINYGTNLPATGNDGELFIKTNPPKAVRYIKMAITAVRSSGCQFSEIGFKTDGGNSFAFPDSTTITGNYEAYGASETVDKLIDGSTSTKYYTASTPTAEVPLYITIDLGSENTINLSTYNHWEWYTANDTPSRDPISFALEISEDGNVWTAIDEQSGYDTTSSRMTIAYTGDIGVSEGLIQGLYVWIDGEWRVINSGGTSDIDFSTLSASQISDLMADLNSGTAEDTEGTFTTGTTQYEKVEVNCGFKPDYIQAILPFSNGNTTATYDASKSTTTSEWYIPMEARTYTITLGSDTGETGITDITDDGFKFRCNARNTRGVECTFVASTGGKTYIQTVSFDDISSSQADDILSKLDFSSLTATQIADLKTALGIS